MKYAVDPVSPRSWRFRRAKPAVGSLSVKKAIGLQTLDPEFLPQEVTIPVSLYKSLQGRYFVGYADNLEAGPGTNAWAGLFNPVGSGVILHVNVITVTNVVGVPFSAEFWLNAQFPGVPFRSPLYTPANTAIRPLPEPRVEILQASDVLPVPPLGGVKIYTQPVYEESTVVFEEDGKYILPEGGSFVVYLNLLGSPTTGRVACGWWEDPC